MPHRVRIFCLLPRYAFLSGWTQVEWLVNAGLTINEVRDLFATYPKIVGVDLNVMEEGVGMLKEKISLAPRQLAKVRT